MSVMEPLEGAAVDNNGGRAANPRNRTAAPGQTATWLAGEQMSGKDPESDPRSPSWFVAFLPEANIELSAFLRTGGGQHFFYKNAAIRNDRGLAQKRYPGALSRG